MMGSWRDGFFIALCSSAWRYRNPLGKDNGVRYQQLTAKLVEFVCE